MDLTGDEDPTDEDGDTRMDDSIGVSTSLGGEISSGGKKSHESNSDHTGGTTVGEAIGACSGGICNSLVASYACMTSIYGSSCKVLGKRKRTDEVTREIGMQHLKLFHRSYILIQDALKFRDVVILGKLQREVKKAFKGKNYSESESDSDGHLPIQLEQYEDRISDAATASTFVAADEDTSALPETPPPEEKSWGCCSSVIDPNQKFPKTDDVPLGEEEKKIWMYVKEYDKDNLGLDEVDYNTIHEHEVPLLVDILIFTVTAFNEAIEVQNSLTINIERKKGVESYGPQEIDFEWRDQKMFTHVGRYHAWFSNYLGELVREFPMYYPSRHHIEEEKKARIQRRLMNKRRTRYSAAMVPVHCTSRDINMYDTFCKVLDIITQAWKIGLVH
nr:hypothetical protein [Tanacetum cinerariifolium]